MIDTIVNSFEIWTDAQGIKSRTKLKSVDNISLEGVVRLRELILDLAVRGNLVPQDQYDETSDVLLKEIVRAKQKLINEGKIKKQSPAIAESDEEKPFQLPVKWNWLKLNEIGYTQTGGTPSKNNLSYFGNYIPFIKPGDIYSTHVEYLNEGLSLEGMNALGRVAPKGSILMVCIGTIGKCNSIDRECTFNQQINSITPYIPVTDFLKISLTSNYFQRTAWNNSSSTTIAILNKGKWDNIYIPLPPLAEQHRIVAKVDELMGLCDKLEEEQFNNLKTHQVLVKTLLETLTQAADANELQAAWERMSVHFDTLFFTDDSIDQLKQTILQLAIMGKLVKQDPNDEPASELLKKIKKEKDKLVEKGKIKKQASLPVIVEEEKPFALPTGWNWERWGNIANWITYGFTRPVSHNEKGIPIITGKNVNEERIIFETADFISNEEYHQLNDKDKPKRGDILLTKDGSIGRAAIVETAEPLCINQSVAILWVKDKPLNKKYMLTVIISPFSQNLFLEKASGVAIKHISVTHFGLMLCPIPPIMEQTKIVEKIDALFSLCDSLKEKIQKSQAIKILLSKTIVEKAVE